ncbi:hypothetical protein GCM10022236_14530 [Microlunatus ginsengisoli]|uniref:Uncharacterized protein n=1 Tax=Microlunatus ginsengisoli TaxID=363863 RepID=A0ABP6ZLJ3_9ACTN
MSQPLKIGPVTFLVALLGGELCHWTRYDLLPLSSMIRGVLLPGLVALADR